MINKFKPYLIGIVLIAAIVSVNWLVTKLPNVQLDVTSNKLHTLSNVTKKTIKELNNEVIVKVFITDDLPSDVRSLSSDMTIILKELSKQNPSKFKLNFLNPLKDETAKADAAKYGIRPLQFSSIKSDKFEVQNGYFGLVIISGDKQDVMPVAGDVGNLEYFLISGVKRLISPTTPTIVLVEDDSGSQQGNLQYLRKFLDRSYNVLGANLDTDSSMPVSASTLVIVGRSKKIDDKGMIKLKKWIADGKGIIAFLDKVTVGPNMSAVKIESTGLEALFEDSGIKIGQGLVVDQNSAVANFRTQNGTFVVKYPYWPLILQDKVNSSVPAMSGINSLSLAWATPVEATNDKVSILFSSSQSSEVDETVTDVSPVSKKPQTGNAGKSFSLGAIRTDGAKLAVVGDADMIKDQFVVNNQQNLSVALNLVDYFSQDSSMFLIRNKVIKTSPIKQVSEAEKQIYRITNLLLPIIIIGITYALNLVIRKKQNRILIDSRE